MNTHQSRSSAYWIQNLKMKPHEEGGYYSEFYRSSLQIPRDALPEIFPGSRPACTGIYFLLENEQFSAFHRIKSDETWHFYEGDPLVIFEILKDGSIIEHRLGKNPENHEYFHSIVQAGNWFAASLAEGNRYALVGCTVSPGFDFADFELAKRDYLLENYPQHKNIILAHTRT